MENYKKYRGVILAGGFGTRMFPATSSNNKHLLPVYSGEGAVPMIEYPLLVLEEMGCKEILIITSREHCGKIVEHLGDGYDRGVSLTYKIQEMNDPNRLPGIASALRLCEDFTKDEPFAVVLGDNFFEYNPKFTNILKDFEDNDEECCLFLSYTENWRRFGIASLDHIEKNVLDIVEKPKEFISNWAVTGLYLYKSSVYNVAKDLKPSNRGELEITDINNYFVNRASVKAITLDTFWSDMGTPESMIKTIKFLENNE